MRISYGIGIASSDAVAAGSGSLPDPGAEPDYPWLWWGETMLQAENAAAEEVFGTSAQIMQIDSKAMRKVKPGETLFFILERSLVAGAPVTLTAFSQCRVLIGV